MLEKQNGDTSNIISPIYNRLVSVREVVRSYAKNLDTKALILLEHEGQVTHCLEWLDEMKGHKQFIALSPFVMHELDKQGIPYKIPEDYYTHQEFSQSGISSYQKVENICQIIDKTLQKACPALQDLGIKPALFNFYYQKMLYETTIVRLFQLFKITDTEKPDVVFIYGSDSYPFGISAEAAYTSFDNRESIYARILALDGWNMPVVILPGVQYPENAPAQGKDIQGIPNKLRVRVVEWLQAHPKLLALALAVQRWEWRGLFGRLKWYLQANKSTPVLLFGAGYNWEDCWQELRAAGISPVFRMDDDLGHWLGEPPSEGVNCEDLLNSWEELIADGEFRRFFVWKDIDFFPVVEDRLRFLVERLTLACLKAYEEASGLLKNKGIKLVLGSTFSTCTSRSVSQAARNMNIPVVTWQHGAYGVKYSPIFHYLDLTGSNVHFVFGEGIVEYFTESAKRFGARLVPVGSASLDVLTRKHQSARVSRYIRLNQEKKVVVYVTTNLHQNDFYIRRHDLPMPSDNHNWRRQQAILDTLGNYGDYTIIIKEFPSLFGRDAPLRSYATEKSFENCQFIKNECSFADLLSVADAIVMDACSTPLLQALTTSKPIFVYSGPYIGEQFQRLLGQRASCYQDFRSFLQAIDRFLSGGVMDVDLNDTEFLRKYGTHEGASGLRAAEALNEIIQNYSK